MLNVLKGMLARFMNMLERRGISREDLRRDWKLLPNVISYVRLALSWVPAAMVVVWSGDRTWRWVAFGLFVGLALTDWVDGFIARKFTMTSEWGKLIDPLGDKLLVAFTTPTLLVVFWSSAIELYLVLVVVVIFVREITLTAQIRRARQGIAPPTFLGKVKTTVQFVVTAALIMPVVWSGQLLFGALTITLGLTVLSWSQYYVLYVQPFSRSQSRVR